MHRSVGLPILVSGGRVHDEHSAEASLMAAALREVFDVPVRWLEAKAETPPRTPGSAPTCCLPRMSAMSRWFPRLGIFPGPWPNSRPPG
nr:YdcF family protein [Halomonas sp. BC04]